LFEGEFFVNFVHVQIPIGGAWARGVASLAEKVRRKKCFVEVKNKDELCLARAIVIAKATLTNHPKLMSIKNTAMKMQASQKQNVVLRRFESSRTIWVQNINWCFFPACILIVYVSWVLQPKNKSIFITIMNILLQFYP
jgi:hypothetical protein